MPYAHFDAEKFADSNKRVIDFKENIRTYLAKKDYSSARKLTGQILHTIQDFYSHSNWVEMNKTTINTDIGKTTFGTSNPTLIDNKTTACNTSCTITKMGCGKLVTIMVSLIKLVGLGKTVSCPVEYYKCEGNIIELNKLVSGYYSGQKLDNVATVDKPTGLSKCSHGMCFTLSLGYL